MDKQDKFIDSLVYEYLKRVETNSSVLFSVNRKPVSINDICNSFFIAMLQFLGCIFRHVVVMLNT